MKALILAAGYATRLYPLTQDKPKCFLTVGPGTILDLLVRKLEALKEVTEILIVTNSKFTPQFLDWKKNREYRLPVKIIDDGTLTNETRLGAVGDFSLAIRSEKISSDVLLLASDNLFDQDLAEFAAYGLKRSPAVSVATYDLGNPELAAGKFGVFEVDPGGKVIGMEEKPSIPRTALIGVGVYFFPKASLALVETYLKDPRAKDAPGFFIRWLREKGSDIFAFQFKGLWYDIGDLDALREANFNFNKVIRHRSPQTGV